MIWFRQNITVETAEKYLTSVEEKWLNFAISTQPIDKSILEINLTQLYQKLGLNQPEILYFSSPYQLIIYLVKTAINDLQQEELNLLIEKIKLIIVNRQQGFLKKIVTVIIETIKNQITLKFGTNLNQEIKNKFREFYEQNKLGEIDLNLKLVISKKRASHQQHKAIKQISKQIQIKLDEQLLLFILEYLSTKITNNIVNHTLNKIIASLSQVSSLQTLTNLSDSLTENLLLTTFIDPESLCLKAIEIDYYNYINNNKFISSELWQIWQNILANSGWLMAYNSFCFISEHYQKIYLNSQSYLHGIENLAIQYGDKWGLYAYNGVILPPEYGKISPENWQSQWLLTEKNSELRRVLIQGIGYDKIASELEAEELDSWREYTILKFNNIIDDLDGQPISLLKMTCPSTNFIHALRIPPDFVSAREAISWINWGIDPEDIIIAS